MKKIFKTICISSTVIVSLLFVIIFIGQLCIPESITIYSNKSHVVFMNVFSVDENDIRSEVNAVSGETGNRTGRADVKLFGVIPVENIRTVVSDRKSVRVSGDIIGIRLYSDGLLIVGIDDIATSGGNECPGEDCGLREGDVISEADGKKISSASEFASMVNNGKGKDISLKVIRDDEVLNLTLTPVYSDTEKTYRCGLWLRDSTAGIGTMTFFDESTGMFAALGHAVSDAGTNKILAVGCGDVLGAKISGYTAGIKGSTGQIKGSFTSEYIGTLYENNEFGVYGTYSDAYSMNKMTEYPVASQTEIETSAAKIISTINDNGPKFYDIEIEKISLSESNSSRSMTIKVTDEELLRETGGIIQGMSGSPIIQNGMLVGAVTHVFLNEPSKGYGVFAETMVEEEEGIHNLISQSKAS